MLSNLEPQTSVSAAVARVREDPVGFWMNRLDVDSRPAYESQFDRWMRRLNDTDETVFRCDACGKIITCVEVPNEALIAGNTTGTSAMVCPFRSSSAPEAPITSRVHRDA